MHECQRDSKLRSCKAQRPPGAGFVDVQATSNNASLRGYSQIQSLCDGGVLSDAVEKFCIEYSRRDSVPDRYSPSFLGNKGNPGISRVAVGDRHEGTETSP